MTDADVAPDDPPTWQVATQRAPTDDERAALDLAWRVCRHVKSNAIVLVATARRGRRRRGPDEPRRQRPARRREGRRESVPRAPSAPRTPSTRSPTRSRFVPRPASRHSSSRAARSATRRSSPPPTPPARRCSDGSSPLPSLVGHEMVGGPDRMEHDAQPTTISRANGPSSTNPEWDSSANPTDAAPDEAGPKTAAGREMLVQLQQMIDTSPPRPDRSCAKLPPRQPSSPRSRPEGRSARLQGGRGDRESLGQQVAARSKDFAADLRRGPEERGRLSRRMLRARRRRPAAKPRTNSDEPPATDSSAWS